MSENKFTGKCPIWGTPAFVGPIREGKILVDSPRTGGSYEIYFGLLDDRNNIEGMENEQQKARLTTILVDRRRQGDDMPYIDYNDIENAKKGKNISIYERANRLLKYFVKNSKNIGHNLNIYFVFDPSNEYHDWESYKLFLECLAWSESIEEEEFQFLIDYLANRNFLSRMPRAIPFYKTSCCVLLEGYRKVEEDILNPDSSQAFVAMWFGEEMDNIYEEGIEKSIKNTGYKPLRIDRKEDVNKIDDEIIAEIRRSRFLIADFTQGDDGARGGVYYEAGFAQGLGITVIRSCRKDIVDENKLHFDTRQYHHVVWETADELRDGLEKRILALIGEGPLITTTAP